MEKRKRFYKQNERWDVIYDTPMSAQCNLRDNAARFRKGKLILNPIEVREIENIEAQLRIVILIRNENI